MSVADLEGVAPADALVIRADGGMRWRGEVVGDVADFVAAQPEAGRVRVVPDRALPAADLVRIGAGAARGGGGPGGDRDRAGVVMIAGSYIAKLVALGLAVAVHGAVLFALGPGGREAVAVEGAAGAGRGATGAGVCRYGGGAS